MFENLTERLSRTVQQLRGKGRLTEDGIRETLREVRIALLEADVALPVVQTFVSEVREKALGQEVLQSLTPGQALVKLVHDELVEIMGTQNEALDLRAQPPVCVLMAGLQGSGKTTTTAKLARLLIEREKKRVMVVSCDVYRPAAIKQLETLAGQVGIADHRLIGRGGRVGAKSGVTMNVPAGATMLGYPARERRPRRCSTRWAWASSSRGAPTRPCASWRRCARSWGSAR